VAQGGMACAGRRGCSSGSPGRTHLCGGHQRTRDPRQAPEALGSQRHPGKDSSPSQPTLPASSRPQGTRDKASHPAGAASAPACGGTPNGPLNPALEEGPPPPHWPGGRARLGARPRRQGSTQSWAWRVLGSWCAERLCCASQGRRRGSVVEAPVVLADQGRQGTKGRAEATAEEAEGEGDEEAGAGRREEARRRTRRRKGAGEAVGGRGREGRRTLQGRGGVSW